MEENIRMFKAYDIRTKQHLLEGEARRILISSIVKYYKEDLAVSCVVLSRDARLHCASLMENLVEEFVKYGLDVLVNPLQSSTCLFYYSCMMNPDAAGIMITASHNPGEYVGFKFVGRNCAAIASGCGVNGGIDRIKEYYVKELLPEKSCIKGSVKPLFLQNEYVEYSMKLAGVEAGSLKGMRIFGEFLSGSSGMDFLLAFSRAGAEVTLSDFVPDGFFPSGDPNPVVESSTAPARRKMRDGEYDLGFCFDGDGDRMDLMFPDGEQIIPGLNMSMLVPYIKQIFSPYYDINQLKCFVDVKAIPLAIIEIARTGIEPHIIRNGHSFIKEKLREHKDEGYVAAEEESAHYYMNFPYDPDHPEKGFVATENTLFYSLLSARAMKENMEGYARIKEMQKHIFRYREWPLNFVDHTRMNEIMDEVERKMQSLGCVVIKDMDDGSDLDATLMRFNLPSGFDSSYEFPSSWCQVAQRISRSEDAMTRWEVVASDEEICKKYNDIVKSIADRFVAEGAAYY